MNELDNMKKLADDFFKEADAFIERCKERQEPEKEPEFRRGQPVIGTAAAGYEIEGWYENYDINTHEYILALSKDINGIPGSFSRYVKCRENPDAPKALEFIKHDGGDWPCNENRIVFVVYKKGSGYMSGFCEAQMAIWSFVEYYAIKPEWMK